MPGKQLRLLKSVLLNSSLTLSNYTKHQAPKLALISSSPHHKAFATAKMPSRVVPSADNLPTLSSLYRSGHLPSDLPTAPLRKPSQDLNRRVSLVRADITTLAVDAIVNAANNSLRGGGGVDGAIHRAAGRGLVHECRTRYPDGCDTGDAVITAGHNLPARNVIHTVGPIYEGEAASEPLLRSCYRACLRTAVENDCATIAFSGISTGVYGYPADEAAHVACSEVRDFLERQDTEGKIQRVIFVTFLDKDVNAYNSILPLYFPPAENESSPAGTD
ncbi:hypothetical protein V8C26DRAFT_251624 [Trichoderma gracile]